MHNPLSKLQQAGLLPPTLKHTFVAPAELSQGRDCLGSGHSPIDSFLNGGIPKNSVSEIGIPEGKPGREVLIPFLAKVSQEHLILWVNSLSQLHVYPPAFYAKGVCSNHLIFSNTDTPVASLKPALLSPLFKVIVLDSSRLSNKDLIFLQQKIREHQQTLIVIRPYFLSNAKGNIWSQLRLNIARMNSKGQYRLRMIKGSVKRDLLVQIP